MSLLFLLFERVFAGFDRNAFNQFVSDRIPLDRQFPDKRNKECFDQRYYPNFVLPKTRLVRVCVSVCGHKCWCRVLIVVGCACALQRDYHLSQRGHLDAAADCVECSQPLPTRVD